MNAVLREHTEFDDVKKARHYNSHPSGVEAIEVIRFFPGNMFNAFKYVYRAGIKADEDTVKDLEKALYYLNDELKWLPSRPMRMSTAQYTHELMTKIATADSSLRGKALRAIHCAAVAGDNGGLIQFAIGRVEALKYSFRSH